MSKLCFFRRIRFVDADGPSGSEDVEGVVARGPISIGRGVLWGPTVILVVEAGGGRLGRPGIVLMDVSTFGLITCKTGCLA